MGLYHIIAREAWARAQTSGEYRPASLASEGFIHLSEDRQLLPSAERHFRRQGGLLVLSIRRDRLLAELRYDDAHGELFPHLYGPLNLDAVVEVVDLPVGDDDRFRVPAEWHPRADDFGPGE